MILIGGSTSNEDNIDELIVDIKSHTDIPVILFPGNSYQLSDKADALLMLSLISGRNPEYLIGKQVEAAPIIRSKGLKTIPTGYMMVGSGKISSTSYMTQTMPIPEDKPEIAAQTAMAGEMLGMRAIYLEAGSGSDQVISSEMIDAVREAVDVTLIVGGGIRYPEQVTEVFRHGADIAVIGTVIEEDPEVLVDFHRAMNTIKATYE